MLQEIQREKPKKKASAPVTIRQMRRAAPATFQIGTRQPAPSFTLEQWAARQPVLSLPSEVQP